MNTDNFQFDQRIDTGILNDLYENDYLYIEEVFKTTMENYEGDVEALKAHYASGNLEGLRKAAHKIKPVFGYLGMPLVQESCKNFEDKCQKAATIEEIMTDYEKLQQQLGECKKIIESDLQKLSEYNNHAR